MTEMVSSWGGSWKCGKAGAFPTFPQAFLFLFKKRIPDKLTTKEGEGGATAPIPSVTLFLRHFCHIILT